MNLLKVALLRFIHFLATNLRPVGLIGKVSLLATIVILVASLVLLGWIFDLSLLKGVWPGSLSTMKANTAVAFWLSGVSLGLLQRDRVPRSSFRCAQGMAVGAIAIGGLTLIQYLFGWNLGIDQLLFQDPSPSATTFFPGRMGVNTAFNFVLTGVALLLLAQKTRCSDWICQSLICFTVMISLIALLGHLFEASFLYKLAEHTTIMAVPTAVTFLILGMGILLTRPTHGLMQPLSSPLVGGLTARRLLPWVFTLPLGMLCLLSSGQSLGWYDRAAQAALEVVVIMLTFFVLIWRNAKALNQVDQVRQQMYQQLRESERRFRNVFDQAPFVVQIYDLNGALRQTNHVWEEMWGDSREVLAGYNVLQDQQFAAFGQLPLLQQAFAGAAITLTPMFYNPAINGHQGRSRWLEGTAYPIRSDGGEVQEVVIVTKDITDRKQAEIALQLNEERFRRALLDAPVPIMLHAEDGEVLQINHAWSEITGYEQEDIPTITAWAEKAYGASQASVRESLARLCNLRQRVSNGEVAVTTRTATTRIWDLYVAPLGKAPDGRRLTISTAIDVTERKQAEVALKQINESLVLKVAERTAELQCSEERWQLAIQGSEDGVWDWNIATGETFRSARWYKILQYEPQELDSSNEEWSTRIHPDDLEAVTLANQAYLSQQTPNYSPEYRIRCKDGTYKWVQSLAKALWDEQGNPLRMIGSMRDISDRKQAEEKLQQKSQRLAAVISAQQDVTLNSLDLDRTMAIIVERVQHLTCASGAIIELVEGDELVYRAASGAARDDVGLRLKVVASLSRRCIETGKILCCNDTEIDSQVDRLAYRRIGVRSIIVVPLLHGERPIGLLKVFSETPAAFNDEDFQTVQLMAGFLATAIHLATEFKSKSDAIAALQESEGRFQAFMNYSPTASWITNENGQILYTSQTYSRMFQIPEDYPLGQSTDSLYAPEFSQQYLQNIRRVVETNQVVEAIEAAPRTDGTIGNFLVYKFPIPNASGQCLVGGVAVDVTERQQAEAALQEKEQLLRLAFEASGDGLWDWNIMTGEHYPSQRWLEMLGYTASDFLGNIDIWKQLIHPEDQPWVLDRLNAHLQDASLPYQFDYRLLTKSGDWKWIANYGKVVVWDASGQPLRMAGIHRDIHTLKQAEQALQQSEVRYRAIVEDQTELIVRYQADGTLTFVNKAYCLYFRKFQEDLLGRRYQPLLFEEDGEQIAQLVATMSPENPVVIIENRVVVAGEVRWTQWCNRMLFDQGQFIEFQAVGRDITTLKQTEARLFQEKELAQVTLQSIGDGVITTDATGKIEYINAVAENLTGWSQSLAQGLPLLEVFKIVNETTREPVENPVEQALQEGRAIGLANHTVLIARDGREIPIDDSAAPIFDRDSHIIGAVMVFHDVTQNRSLSRQLAWQASHDALTELVNRREFERGVEQFLMNAKADKQVHSLCFLDLDRFKIVNDTCGHAAGDELLRQVSTVLQAGIRKTDILARLGGDEFGVLLNQCSLEQALEIANKLRERIQEFRFVWQEQVFTIGVSIGVVSIDAHSEGLATVIRAADTACYAAKSKGRNQVHVSS